MWLLWIQYLMYRTLMQGQRRRPDHIFRIYWWCCKAARGCESPGYLACLWYNETETEFCRGRVKSKQFNVVWLAALATLRIRFWAFLCTWSALRLNFHAAYFWYIHNRLLYELSLIQHCSYYILVLTCFNVIISYCKQCYIYVAYII